MGRTTNVECDDCGYEEGALIVGTGMASGPDDEQWPVACPHCRAIVSSRINRTPVLCARCGSEEVMPLGEVTTPWPGEAQPCYAEDSEQHIERFIKVQWGERVLIDEPSTCPRCGALALRVATRPGILFD